MNNSPQHLAAFRLLEKAGIWKSNYAPPVFRMLWRRGVNVPPPHFMSFLASAALTGIGFGVMWGLFMLAFAAATGNIHFPVLLAASVGAGLLFGVSMATYYAFGRRRHKLPKWSSLPQQPSDA
jgi:hypothetical protein